MTDLKFPSPDELILKNTNTQRQIESLFTIIKKSMEKYTANQDVIVESCIEYNYNKDAIEEVEKQLNLKGWKIVRSTIIYSRKDEELIQPCWVIVKNDTKTLCRDQIENQFNNYLHCKKYYGWSVSEEELNKLNLKLISK